MRDEVAAPLPKPIYLEVPVHLYFWIQDGASMRCASFPAIVTVVTPDVFGKVRLLAARAVPGMDETPWPRGPVARVPALNVVDVCGCCLTTNLRA